MDPRLLAAIGTPAIQLQASELVKLALRALEDLRRLDDSLYERFVQTREAPDPPATATTRLQQLWMDTFRGLLLLLAYCRRVAGSSTHESASAPASDDFDFDLGGFSPEERSRPGFNLDASDIGDLLDSIAEPERQGDQQRWNGVLERLGPIEYGLRSQFEDATARRDVALAAGKIGQVLALLDDTQGAAAEGIHAIVSAVYEAFLPNVDRATVVPAYLTSLKRALLVRRALAELAVQVGPANGQLQGGDSAAHAEALATIRAAVRSFVESPACHAMRAADRWEMAQFERRLRDEKPAPARLTAEGLVKYLESLQSINQREVLVLHDQRLAAELRESLAAARELMDLSPRTAHDLIVKACEQAQALHGRTPVADELLRPLARLDPQATTPAQSATLLQRLEDILAAAAL